MNRVYIHEKLVDGVRCASSSPTAITVRREGTVINRHGEYVTIRFDHTPTLVTRVKKECVFALGA